MQLKRAMAGVGAGAGLMFLFDPNRGRRRRALICDKFVKVARDMEWAAGKTSRDVTNRSHGIVAEAGSLFNHEEPPSEPVLEQRVRSALGRACSHPHAIKVTADGSGKMILTGPVFADELKSVLSTASSVHGVKQVENQLEAHETSEGVPSLQGNGRKPGPRLDIFQNNWAPATRLLMGGLGACMAIYGITHRGLKGMTTSAIGAGLLARGIANRDFKQSLLT